MTAFLYYSSDDHIVRCYLHCIQICCSVCVLCVLVQHGDDDDLTYSGILRWSMLVCHDDSDLAYSGIVVVVYAGLS